MTPEDRARVWLEEEQIYKPEFYLSSLASAIREAENEALERAAADLMEHARVAEEMGSPHAQGWARAALRVRSLKSPSAPGGGTP